MKECLLQMTTHELQIAEFGLSSVQAAINALLLVLTLVSVVCAFIAYKHQKLRAKKDASCTLASFYANDILLRLGPVNHVMTRSGIAERIKQSFPLDKISAFTMDEAETITADGAESLSPLISDLESIDPRIIYGTKILHATTIEERHELATEYVSKTTDPDSGETSSSLAHADLLSFEFRRDVIRLLNNLEWFAMNFRYNLADEKILYQSLHQTYLSNVWSLYLYICLNNQPGAAKYFTNTIWLFNLWNARLRKLEKRALKKREKNAKKAERLEHARNIAEKKYERAKQSEKSKDIPIYTGKPLN